MLGYLFKIVLPFFLYHFNLHYEEIKDNIVLFIEYKKMKTKFHRVFIHYGRRAVE